MIILGIETSCDETALSLIEATGDLTVPNFKILGTALHSQIELHKQYGGVFPMMAKREHAKNIIPLFDSLMEKNILAKVSDSKNNGDKNEKNFNENDAVILDEATQNLIKEIFKKETDLAENFIEYISKTPKQKIDMIAVTSGPGLEPALWVGINFAKVLSLVWNIPLLPVNHMEGHILSVLSEASLDKNKISNINFPAIALLISGGHTEIVLVKSFGNYQIIGQTVDDAVGEAFDKVARILDLEYPGGPKISKLANEAGEKIPEIKLPRPMLNTLDYNFSFSGLKTAVLYLVKKLKEQNLYNDDTRKLVAEEFQEACIEVLSKKVSRAIDEYSAQSLIIGGGVIANTEIRQKFLKLNNDFFKVYIPEMSLATDNAVMIAFAGYLSQFKTAPTINPDIKAEGNLRL
jgi:N6-L-threonylcarbamoyladenine synthase